MKMARIAGKSLLALVVSVTAASATPTSLGYTGGFQTFVAPEAGLYEILAFGAQGGNGGGLGAEIGGGFILSQGETLQVAVGGAGASATGFGGGGGGGTFVVGPGNVALAVAGGGGGAPFPSQGFTQGGLTGTEGGSVIPPFGGSGGTNGGGGGGASGGGGGGFIGNGENGRNFSGSGGGASFGAGLGGGAGAGGAGAGGFGGGGGGAGGYSGGGGGGFKLVPWGGGGAGSFDGGADQILIPDVNQGDGSAVISYVSSISVPEPSALALLGAGVAGLLALRVRRRPTKRAGRRF